MVWTPYRRKDTRDTMLMSRARTYSRVSHVGMLSKKAISAHDVKIYHNDTLQNA